MSQMIDVGQNTTFTAAASGTPTPTVQWQINAGTGFTNLSNGGFYSGVTTTTLTITSASTALSGGSYRAVFTNGFTPDATSNAATLTVNAAVSLSATTLPASTVGVLYNQMITASNGTGTKTMMVSNYNAGGTGLAAPSTSANTVTFNSTPTAAGTVSFDLTATDTVNGTAMQHYAFTINGAVTLSPTSLPASTAGVLYSQTITASNGTGNKTMMVSNYNAGGTGLAAPSTSTNTVTFNSTPTAAGTVSFDLTATDAVNGTAMQHYSFSINAAVTVSPTSLPASTVGVLYNQTITASNGTGNKTMMVSNYNAGGTGLAAPSTSANTVTFNSTPTAAGTVSFDLTATDTVNGTAMQHYSFSIGKATPTVSVSDAGGTYTGNPFPASATVTGINGMPGNTLEGMGLTLTYYSGTYTLSTLPPSGGSSTAPSQAGSYTVVACFPGSTDYNAAKNLATFGIAPKSATVTANNKSRIYGAANPPLDATVTGTVNGDVLNYTLATSATPSSPVGPYDITVTLGSNPNYSVTPTKGTLTVSPAPLTATAVNFSATAGAPFSGTVASFTNVAPNTTPYTALIDWGDGSTSTMSISVSGSAQAVTGAHTYADSTSYLVQVQISNPNILTATLTDTATVGTLERSVQAIQTKPTSWWANPSGGLELIGKFGLTAGGQTPGQWLASTFPKLYGGSNGAPNLSSFTNAQVAAYYQKLFTMPTQPLSQAEVMAPAFEVFTTTRSLGGMVGQSYGFEVNDWGLGAYSCNIGMSGQAFGVPNMTQLNVYQILLAANNNAVGGRPWDADLTLRNQALSVFRLLNREGAPF